MADPIFQNEPAPAQPPRRRLSSGAKIAIGCAVLFVLASGACGGAMLWCGAAVSKMGRAEWTDLRAVVADLATDEGARTAYANHPRLAEAYPTAEDFVGAARLWRRDLEPLPPEPPPLLSGRLSTSKNYANGHSKVGLRYSLSSGKALAGTWVDGQLADLQLE